MNSGAAFIPSPSPDFPQIPIELSQVTMRDDGKLGIPLYGFTTPITIDNLIINNATSGILAGPVTLFTDNTPNMYFVRSLTGGSLSLGGSIIAAQVTLKTLNLPNINLTPGHLILNSSTLGPSSITSISFTPGSLLDLGPEALITQLSVSTLLTQIKSARADGSWTGSGITSSLAIADPSHYTVGIIDIASHVLSSYNGATLTSGSLVATASIGDANLDLVVDVQDQSLITNHWQKPGNNWATGDLNLDGIVDLQDLTLVTNNWQQSSAFSKLPITNYELPPSPIPEPLTLPLVGLPLIFRRKWGRGPGPRRQARMAGR